VSSSNQPWPDPNKSLAPPNPPPIRRTRRRRDGEQPLKNALITGAIGVITALLIVLFTPLTTWVGNLISPPSASSVTLSMAYLSVDRQRLPSVVDPRSLGEADFPNDQDCRSVASWSLANGGVWASGNTVRLQIENHGSILEVQSLSVRVSKRHPAPAGTIFRCESSGSEQYPTSLLVNLDQTTPVVRKKTPDGAAGEVYGTDSVIDIADNQTHNFDITANTEKCLCQWQIFVEYTKDGKRQTVPVSPVGGGDLRTAADTMVSQQYFALEGSTVWAK
jgi:hypothetical protein